MPRYAVGLYDPENGELNVTLEEGDTEMAVGLRVLLAAGIDLDFDEEEIDWSNLVEALEEQTGFHIDYVLIP